MRRLFAAACCVALACTPKPSTTAAPEPAAPGAPNPTPQPATPIPNIPAPVPTPSNSVRFGPATGRYVVHQHVRMDHDPNTGMPATTQLGWSTFVTATVTGPAATTGYPAIFTVDSIRPDSGVVLPPWIDVSHARGLRYLGYLTASGEFVDGKPSDSAAAENVAMLVGGFQNFYPRIPAAGVNVGDSWTDTLTLVERGGGRVSTRRTLRQARAVAWEDTPSGRAVRLEISERYELTERGSGGGQPFEAKGTGVGASVERVGAGGRFLGTEARDSTNLMITLTAPGLTIPRRQITTTTVTVLP